jgi:hypothetical protein
MQGLAAAKPTVRISNFRNRPISEATPDRRCGGLLGNSCRRVDGGLTTATACPSTRANFPTAHERNQRAALLRPSLCRLVQWPQVAYFEPYRNIPCAAEQGYVLPELAIYCAGAGNEFAGTANRVMAVGAARSPASLRRPDAGFLDELRPHHQLALDGGGEFRR